jgi:hypothetical protein
LQHLANPPAAAWPCACPDDNPPLHTNLVEALDELGEPMFVALYGVSSGPDSWVSVTD